MATQPQNEPDPSSGSKTRKDLFDNLSPDDAYKLEQSGLVEMVQTLLQCAATAHASDLEMQQAVEAFIGRIKTASGSAEISDLKTEIIEFSRKTAKRIQALLDENHSLHERYRSLEERFFDFRSKVVVDEVTETLSRDAFDEQLSKQIQQFKKKSFPFFLGFVEIDNFSSVKKKLSARELSTLLKGVASRVKKGVRDSDPVYRYIEHQFTTLFQNIDYKTTPIIGERICNTVDKAPISLTGEATTDSASLMKVTVSIGFAQFKEGDKAETFFKRAQGAAERAHLNGGNQVALS